MPQNSEADYRRLGLLYDLAVRTGTYRGFKLARGLWRTYGPARSRFDPYDAGDWWEDWYRGEEIGDATTIEAGKSELVTAFHYASIESLILAELHDRAIELDGARVLDIGSGSGHWLDFYLDLGAASVTGVEVSDSAADALAERYRDDPRAEVLTGDIAALPLDGTFDIVNAIGVMFHIVDDEAFERVVRRLVSVLSPGGLLVVGGHFGVPAPVDVQFDPQGRVNKRLRPRRHWRRLLTGLRDVRFVRNPGWRRIRATVPEANLLFARRAAG